MEMEDLEPPDHTAGVKMIGVAEVKQLTGLALSTSLELSGRDGENSGGALSPQ